MTEPLPEPEDAAELGRRWRGPSCLNRVGRAGNRGEEVGHP